MNKLWEVLRFVLSILIIVVPIRMFVAKPFIVSGASMDPTFADREYLIIDELSYHFREPRRGEVVIFRYPADPSKYFIKRVIGLPGETLRLHQGGVSVKQGAAEVLLDEPYLKETFSTELAFTLGPEEYFVMGDNRNVSHDSRAWGALPEDLIIGRPFVRLLPPQRFSLLPGDFTVK